jgi:hypothetical protein
VRDLLLLRSEFSKGHVNGEKENQPENSTLFSLTRKLISFTLPELAKRRKGKFY